MAILQVREEHCDDWYPIHVTWCPVCEKMITFINISPFACQHCMVTLPDYRALLRDKSHRETWYKEETAFQVSQKL